MLLLTATTDNISVTQSAAGTLDIHASYVDASQAAPPVVQGDTMGRTNTAMTTATTTDIVPSPAASETRNVKTIHIRNKHASTSTDVTVNYDQNGTLFELFKANLAPGESLEYVEGIGFFETAPPTSRLPSGAATTAQIAAHSADTYYLGMSVWALGASRLLAGSFFRWTFGATKGAAGTAAPTFNIRFGTAGTTADTSRCLMTGAQTAVADSGIFRVDAVFRAVGASAVIQGRVWVDNFASATTGFKTTAATTLIETTGASFDSTPANSIIGLSVNPGASGAWVVNQVNLDAVNLLPNESTA